MNKKLTAAVLAAGALMLAIGAFILFTNTSSDTPEYRQAVEPPAEAPTAPAWVDTGQEAKPDYTSADTEAQNATPVTEAKEQAKVIEITEDSVVTFNFVESLSNFFLNHFEPIGTNGKPRTTVTSKSINTYYGRDMTGFMVNGGDIRKARQNVLDYAFTPKMIGVLSDLYIPVLLEQLTDSARNEERTYKIGVETENRTLNNSEIKTMLLLNADAIDKTAVLLNGIAHDPTITQRAGQYLQTAKAVERANAQLQRAIADEKDTSLAGRRLKQAIMQREEVKESITDTMKAICPECDSSEAFYLSQWSYRRVLGDTDKKLKTFASAASALKALAKQFRSTADTLK